MESITAQTLAIIMQINLTVTVIIKSEDQLHYQINVINIIIIHDNDNRNN